MTIDEDADPRFAGFHSVEARGMRCPWPALRLAKAMRQHEKIVIYLDLEQSMTELDLVCDRSNWSRELIINDNFQFLAVERTH